MRQLHGLRFLDIGESRNGVQDVKLEERNPAARHELFLWEQKHYCSLPDDMRSFYLASNGFNLIWSSKVDTTVMCVGKLRLNKIQNVTRVGGISGSHMAASLADLESDSDSDGDNDNVDSCDRRPVRPSFNMHKSHMFELDSCDGVGKVCLVYQANQPTSKPDIWFLDRSLRWHYLADSFSSYYRLMVVNLGLPQWQYAFTDVGLSSQAKQWYHMYASLRLELNHGLSSPLNHSAEPTDGDVNKLDSDRLFQINRLNRKKITSSTSSTTASSGVSQSSTSQSNAMSLLARGKKPTTYTQKGTGLSSSSKFNGISTHQSSRGSQFK